MSLGTQAVLWKVGADRPTEPVRPVVDGRWSKPQRGGLWTSTYLGPDELSRWAQWCSLENFGCGTWDMWLLDVDPAANVYTVDTYADLEHLHLCYGRTDRSLSYIDWGLVAERYDAVHLTDEGQWATRLTLPYSLYGWDCESTLWFHWRFTSVMPAGVVEVAHRSYAEDW